MTETEIAAAADVLWQAEQSRTPAERLTDSFDDIGTSDAYAIQQVNIARKLELGDRVRGHKVGLSSKAMQQMLGVNEPDYGHLLASMFIAEDESVPVQRFLQPRAEIEVAFVLNRQLVGPGVTAADVMPATDFICPAIEIVDSRIQNWDLLLADTIADNASSGALVLGGRPTRLDSLDVRMIGATLRLNGRIVETGSSAAVLGNPVTRVAWLANKIAPFGSSLEPGHVVLPGSCIRMVPVRAGDSVHAEFDRLGHVAVQFVDDPTPFVGEKVGVQE